MVLIFISTKKETHGKLSLKNILVKTNDIKSIVPNVFNILHNLFISTLYDQYLYR